MVWLANVSRLPLPLHWWPGKKESGEGDGCHRAQTAALNSFARGIYSVFQRGCFLYCVLCVFPLYTIRRANVVAVFYWLYCTGQLLSEMFPPRKERQTDSRLGYSGRFGSERDLRALVSFGECMYVCTFCVAPCCVVCLEVGPVVLYVCFIFSSHGERPWVKKTKERGGGVGLACCREHAFYLYFNFILLSLTPVAYPL